MVKTKINYPDDSLLPWMGKIIKLFSNKLERQLKENSIFLTKEQWLILKKLNEKDGQTQNEIAKITFSDKTTIARIINNLEKKQLVKRCSNPSDKRVNYIFLTDSGKLNLKKSMPIVRKINMQMEANINEHTFETTKKTLQKVFQNLENI